MLLDECPRQSHRHHSGARIDHLLAYWRMAVSLWTHVTASEPSPTAKPTRLVEPARMSPATRIPGIVVSKGHGSRSFNGHLPETSASVPVTMYPSASLAIAVGSHEHPGSAPMKTKTAARGSVSDE